MKRERMMQTLLAVGVSLLPLVCSAIPEDHPYKSITTRNAFSLVPPPPPAPAVPPTPPANIKLTGISTLRGDKRALLMVQDTSGPGKPEQSVILREGQRDGEVEVLQIDDKAGTVKIRNAGNEAVLSFDQNGVKLPPLPTANTAPQQPPNALPAPPRPGGGPSPTMTGVQQTPMPNSLRQIPTRQMRLPTANPATPQAPTPTPITPAIQRQGEESMLIQQIEMEKNRAANPDHPPLPPTDLTPLLEQ